jgi:hypothetical protein
MLVELVNGCSSLSAALAELDPALLSGSECAEAVEVLARLEKRAAAARSRCAVRAKECRAFKERGFPDAMSWLAHACGSSSGEARASLSAAAAVVSWPATAEALAAGEVSLAQAAEISKTAKAVAGSEETMLNLASSLGLAGLREEGRRRRWEAEAGDKRHRRQRQERYVRHWVDDYGMTRGSFCLPPEVGVPLVNRIDRETDRRLRAQSKTLLADAPDGGGDDGEDGGGLSREQAAANALAGLVLGAVGRRRSVRADVVLVCDIEAFLRGHTHGEEVCQVIGGGPVPVSVAREAAKNAFIKAVLYRGAEISTVAHFGRYINAELRTALGLGPPPLFPGVVCDVPGCDRRYGMEFDHLDPVANGGPTSYENLKARCKPHHREKTERDRLAGLLGPRLAAGRRKRRPTARRRPPVV